MLVAVLMAPSVGYASSSPWVLQTAAGDGKWSSVAFNSGVFVAVANDGTDRVMYSSDYGATWSTTSATAQYSWESVSPHNSGFIAVASDGQTHSVMTAPAGGTSWTSASASPTSSAWSAIIHANGTTVAVASGSAQVMTSTDGTTWPIETAPAASGWQALDYGFLSLNRFVAVGTSSALTEQAMRGDFMGQNWASASASNDAHWSSVAVGGGQAVAVASSGSGDRVMTSPDGLTWTSRTAAADNSWRDVIYVDRQGSPYDSHFVAVSSDGTDQVMISTDGQSWTTVSAAAQHPWVSLAYGSGVIVAVASDGAVMTWDVRAGWGGPQQNNNPAPNNPAPNNPAPNNPAPVVAAPPSTAVPATPMPLVVVNRPAVGAMPAQVTAADADRLRQAPGNGAVRVNGTAVAAEVRRVEVPAAAVDPEDRTEEEVAAVQQAAADLVEWFNESAPEGVEARVEVTNTDTGAVVNGVVVDPRDGVTPVPVPAEDVVLLSAADTKVLFAAASGDAVPADATGAVLEVSEGGVISAVAYGFPAAVPGEVVIFSTPTLLGSFTIGGDGSFAGQMEIPEGLEAGEHTLVLTAGGVTTSLGLVVAGDGTAVITPQPQPISGALPATGADHDLSWLVLLLTTGGLMVLLSRRRYV